MVGRIPVMDVMPVVDLGRLPAKAVVGEPFPVRATVFREGHDRLGAKVVLVGARRRRRPAGADGPDGAAPDRYVALGHPRRRGRLDLRGRGVVRPARDLAARRRAQDPGRASTSS